MKGKNSKVGIIITIILLVLLVIFSNVKNNVWGHITSPFTGIARSVQGGFFYLKNKIAKNDDYFLSLDELKKENEKLKRENEELKLNNMELSTVKAENKTLKEYKDLIDRYEDNTSIPGYIIQKDFSNYSKIIVLNIGRKDGVEVGMTVVAEEGLVGYVISAEEKSSKVQTIVDTASAISAEFVNTDKTLVTRGLLDTNNRVKGTYIDNDVVVNEGDTIVTSGIGGIYPKNITIGKVKEIVNTKNKSNRYVYIETAVNFDNLSNILVLKD